MTTFYKTEIIDPTITRILVLSDIHADINSFIIALRDCGQVIRKKTGIAFNQLELDNDIHKFLSMDKDSADFKDDFNYEWIAENTYVVIVGDIIDGFRPTVNSNTWYLPYSQIEIKLLLFINKLNELATAKNSRVIKVLGNHEFMNMTDNPSSKENVQKYIFPNELTSITEPTDRLNTFLPGNLGHKLLMKDGAGVLLKINNNIFVHGSLEDDKDLNYYDTVNQILNNSAHPNLQEVINMFNGSTTEETMVWNRKYGLTEDIDTRVKIESIPIERLEMEDFDKLEHCTNVQQNLKTLTGLSDIKKLRVIVGHCIQSESTIFNLNNTTFTNNITDVDKPFIEYIEPPSSSGLADATTNFLFGITMECNKSHDLKDHYLYHVDIGSSRAFDQDAASLLIDTRNKEKLNLLSRTPQLLEIYNNDMNVRIIRSTMKNTRIHLPRPNYEAHVKLNNLAELDLATYKKYLKYKNKYLVLKKEMSTV